MSAPSVVAVWEDAIVECVTGTKRGLDGTPEFTLVALGRHAHVDAGPAVRTRMSVEYRWLSTSPIPAAAFLRDIAAALLELAAAAEPTKESAP